MGNRGETQRVGSTGSKGNRLDNELVRLGLAVSRERARALIMAGRVYMDHNPVSKPGVRVPMGADIQLIQPDHPYVSRGGLKLAGALDGFGLDVAGSRVLDIGASTGGFTHCLLMRGAARITALDVGRGQLAWALRTDPRVSVLEGANARYLPRDAFDEPFDLITIDVSFISILKVLPALVPHLSGLGKIIALIKPQFEAGKGSVASGGVVRDPEVHETVLRTVTQGIGELGLSIRKLLASQVLGPKGNIEFFAMLERGEGGDSGNLESEISALVAAAHAWARAEKTKPGTGPGETDDNS